MAKTPKPLGPVGRAIARVVFGPKDGRMGASGSTSTQMWAEFDKGKRGDRR